MCLEISEGWGSPILQLIVSSPCSATYVCVRRCPKAFTPLPHTQPFTLPHTPLRCLNKSLEREIRNLTGGGAGGPSSPTWPFLPLSSSVARPAIFWLAFYVQKFLCWLFAMLKLASFYPVILGLFILFFPLRFFCQNIFLCHFLPCAFLSVFFHLFVQFFLSFFLHLFLQSFSSFPSPLHPPSPPPARRGTFSFVIRGVEKGSFLLFFPADSCKMEDRTGLFGALLILCSLELFASVNSPLELSPRLSLLGSFGPWKVCLHCL